MPSNTADYIITWVQAVLAFLFVLLYVNIQSTDICNEHFSIETYISSQHVPKYLLDLLNTSWQH